MQATHLRSFTEPKQAAKSYTRRKSQFAADSCLEFQVVLGFALVTFGKHIVRPESARFLCACEVGEIRSSGAVLVLVLVLSVCLAAWFPSLGIAWLFLDLRRLHLRTHAWIVGHPASMRCIHELLAVADVVISKPASLLPNLA